MVVRSQQENRKQEVKPTFSGIVLPSHFSDRAGYLSRQELELVYGAVVLQRYTRDAAQQAESDRRGEVLKAYRDSDGQDIQCKLTVSEYLSLVARKEPLKEQKKQASEALKQLKKDHADDEDAYAQAAAPYEQILADVEKQMLQLAVEEYQLGFKPLSVLLSMLTKDLQKEAVRQFRQIMHNQNSSGAKNKLLSRAAELFGKMLRSHFDVLIMAYPFTFDIAVEALDELVEELEAFVMENVTRLAHVFSDFCNSEFLHSISNESLEQLFWEYLCVMFYPEYRLEFRVGFGGSVDALNIRIPSYFMFALMQMQSFIKHDAPNVPRLLFLNAYSLAVHYNAMDEDLARCHAEQTEDLVRAFIVRFFPECEEYVMYSMPDTGPVIDTERFAHDLAFLEAVVDGTKDVPQQDGESDKAYGQRAKRVRKALIKLTERGQIHGGRQGKENALRYIAAHTQSRLFGNYCYLEDVVQQPDGVIKCGGKGEVHFNEFQLMLVHAFDADGEHFLTNTAGGQGARPIFVDLTVGGAPPPYYSAGEDEILLCAEALARFDSLADIESHYQQAFPNLGTPYCIIRISNVLGEAYYRFLQDYVGLSSRLLA